MPNGRNRPNKNRIVLEGTTVGRLLVLRPVRESGQAIKYACLCSCGIRVVVGGQALRLRKTQSCGCLQRERAREANFRHGLSRTRIHNIWHAMLQRCDDEKCAAYPAYGGRGIDVCSEWHVFENFLHDMGQPPEGMTLDRKDNGLGYSKSNCRWATRRVQANNRRNNKLISFHGKTMTQAEWERALRLKPGAIWQRLNRGWSIEHALTADL